jgi:hypothetical protein
MKKQIEHHVICTKCNKEYLLLTAAYDKRQKRGDKDFLCKACTQKKIWNKLSNKDYSDRCLSQKERWAKLSTDEKDHLMSKTRKAQLKYSRSPESKARLIKRNKSKWNSLSKKDKEIELNRLNQIRTNYWNSLSEEEKYLKMKKMWDRHVNIGPTEHVFNNDISSRGLLRNINYEWGYNTFPYLHPEYYQKFGIINPVTSELNFPYHKWDFIIYSKNGNNILIDVDGSAHNKDSMLFTRGNNNFSEREKIDYNDSQRPYQIPFNMDAYVIECYNDNLNNDTIVLNLLTRKKMTYKNLMGIIMFSQLTKKELKKAI